MTKADDTLIIGALLIIFSLLSLFLGVFFGIMKGDVLGNPMTTLGIVLLVLGVITLLFGVILKGKEKV